MCCTKVELLVAGGGPEVVALDGVLLGAVRPSSPTIIGAALLAEGRVGQHHVEALAGVGRQRVAHHDGHRFVAANAVQHHVHRAQARRACTSSQPRKGFSFRCFFCSRVRLGLCSAM
jgi:hypothetical protein